MNVRAPYATGAPGIAGTAFHLGLAGAYDLTDELRARAALLREARHFCAQRRDRLDRQRLLRWQPQ